MYTETKLNLKRTFDDICNEFCNELDIETITDIFEGLGRDCDATRKVLLEMLPAKTDASHEYYNQEWDANSCQKKKENEDELIAWERINSSPKKEQYNDTKNRYFQLFNEHSSNSVSKSPKVSKDRQYAAELKGNPKSNNRDRSWKPRSNGGARQTKDPPPPTDIKPAPVFKFKEESCSTQPFLERFKDDFIPDDLFLNYGDPEELLRLLEENFKAEEIRKLTNSQTTVTTAPLQPSTKHPKDTSQKQPNSSKFEHKKSKRQRRKNRNEIDIPATKVAAWTAPRNWTPDHSSSPSPKPKPLWGPSPNPLPENHSSNNKKTNF